MRLLPWCFQLGLTEEGDEIPTVDGIHLIKSDGGMERYADPVQVGDVLSEFPNHMICCSDSVYLGRMIPSLSSREHLRHGGVYFLLPDYLFTSTLSFLSISSFNSSCCGRAFALHRTPAGGLKLGLSEEFVKKMVGEEKKGGICTSDVLNKEYRQLVEHRRSCKWKPVLHTISEERRRRRRRR